MTLKKRFYGHIGTIKSPEPKAAVGVHFRGCCGIKNLTIKIIDKAPTQKCILALELFWIHTIGTLKPEGLNILDGQLSPWVIAKLPKHNHENEE